MLAAVRFRPLRQAATPLRNVLRAVVCEDGGRVGPWGPSGSRLAGCSPVDSAVLRTPTVFAGPSSMPVRWMATSGPSDDAKTRETAGEEVVGATVQDESREPEGGPAGKGEVADTTDLAVLRRLGMLPEQLVAKEGFNRWLVVPAATLNHLCLGSVFAWSIFNQPLMRLQGVLAQAATDWTMADVSVTFSLIMGGFVWGAVLSKTLDRWGPRASCLVGASCLGSGFLLGSVAMSAHSLPLLYTAGTVWGLANGWAYVPPVATLLKWFPDRKGFASGMTIMGYGGGAMIATPLFSWLLDRNSVAPTRVGSTDEVHLVNEGGKLFASYANELQEVIVATAQDVKGWGVTEGVYLVGTGSTGAAETFVALGLGYAAVMGLSAFAYRLPHAGYEPASVKAATKSEAKDLQLTKHNISVAVGTRSPQFWLLWAGFGFAVTGSYGIISSGKTLVTEAFGSSMPDVVTPAFTATFVAAMSASNMGGRLFWSNMSDFVAKKIGGDPLKGRKLIFATMWGLGAPLYMAVVWSIHESAQNPGLVPLGVFCGSVFLILGSFGGSAATRPAITADVFGTKHVGVMTARQLSVVMPAAFIGPRITAYLRESSMNEAIEDLVTKVDDTQFLDAFGAGKENLEQLVAAKTVNLTRMMDIVPPGTPDPTHFIYDKTMFVMAGLQAMAFMSNAMVKPFDSKHHED